MHTFMQPTDASKHWSEKPIVTIIFAALVSILAGFFFLVAQNHYSVTNQFNHDFFFRSVTSPHALFTEMD